MFTELETQMHADGPEQREAEIAEWTQRDRARDAAEFGDLLTDGDEPALVMALSDEETILELKALLNDIVRGADMMLNPVLKVSGSFLSYVREVKRVALAGRDL